MFRQCEEAEYEEMSEGGTRYLFQLDHFTFHDTLDGHGLLHCFAAETAGDATLYFEVDRGTMYEMMARYLAGVYEREHYEIVPSPTHAALMDVIELAAARARSGDADFAFDHEAVDVEEEAGDDGRPDGFAD